MDTRYPRSWISGAEIRCVRTEWQLGGGVSADVVTLHDGSVLVIGRDTISIAKSEDAIWDGVDSTGKVAFHSGSWNFERDEVMHIDR